IKLFDAFLEKNARDSRAGKARVLRAMAKVKQYATGASPVWSNALEAEHEMASQVAKEPDYSDYRAELTELVLKTAEGLADRAKTVADAKSLEQAEEAVKFHDQLGGQVAQQQRARSRVPAKLAEARPAVTKAAIRVKALADMDAAIKAKSSAGVFAARDALVGTYPDQAADRAVIDRLTRANDLIRQAVRFDPSRRAAETNPRADPLGPPTSLVLRSKPGEPPSKEPIPVYALAEGCAYAVDGNNGTPLWHLPVGQSSPFPPQAISGGDASALFFDARNDELVR